MSTEVLEIEAAPATCAAERHRILCAVLDDVDAVARRAVQAICHEIPAYARQDPRFLEEVFDQIVRHYRTKLASFMEGRTLTLQDIAFVRGAAMRRARAGFALEDFVNAYRVGQQVFWAAILESAGSGSAGHEAALTLAAPVMRYVDFATTHAAHAYVDFQRHAVAAADAERRDLLELLLSGTVPSRGPLLGTMQAYSIHAEAPMMVLTAVPVLPLDVDSVQTASTAIVRAAAAETTPLVAMRQGEIVAVPVLGGDSCAEALCARLQAAAAELRDAGTPMAIGISTIARGVADLPRAHLEARAALECVSPDGGVAALSRLSPFEYLALRADATATRLIDPRLRDFLGDDRARGGVMIATLRAFADADLNLRVAGERLHVHPNTAQYRLRRIEERTGRNPRRVRDLLYLLVALALEDRGGEQGRWGAPPRGR